MFALHRIFVIVGLACFLPGLGGCSFALQEQRSVRLTPTPTHDSLDIAMQRVSGLRDIRRERGEAGAQSWTFQFAGSPMNGRLHSGPTAEVVQVEAWVNAKPNARLREEALRLADHVIRELEVLLPATARLAEDWEGYR